MKTEPTEARCHIMTRSFGNGYGDEIMVREDAEEAVNMAFREGQSNPKIKQLEWMETSSRYFAGSPVGDYTILRVHNFDEKELCRLYFNGRIIVNDIDLDGAKSAAQADFEKRIKECLDYE